jgi:hypothetical protein
MRILASERSCEKILSSRACVIASRNMERHTKNSVRRVVLAML